MAVSENGNAPQLFYTYTDHLGSITAVTNAQGNVIARQNFDAWGRRRNALDYSYLPQHTTNIDNGISASGNLPQWLYRGYTGHEMLDEFALINMNARLYDPVLGMMLSPDNYIQDPSFTQNYNRYGYCFNNPLRYTDPSGNAVIADDIAAAVIGGVLNVASNWKHIDNFGEGAAYFGIGAAGGWVGLYTAGVVGGAVIAAGNSLMQGENGKTIAFNGFMGALTGLATFGVSSAMSSWAPNYDIIGNLALRYTAKAGYSFASGYASSASTNMIYQWLQNDFDIYEIDFKKVNYAGISGGTFAAGISLGYSAYDFATFDRYDNTTKVEILNKKYGGHHKYMSEAKYEEFRTQFKKSKPYKGQAGITDPCTGQAYMFDDGLVSYNLAKMTYLHEGKHHNQWKAGIDITDQKVSEPPAYKFEIHAINRTTQSRYINSTNENYKFWGGVGNVYTPRFSNNIFNIIR
jgi:RHS repeat-associated protein